MRISVIGNGKTANALRGNLSKAGFRVAEQVGLLSVGYEVYIEEYEGPNVVVDGVDSELERHMVNGIAGLTETPILLQRAGGVQSDRAIRVKVGPNDRDQRAVELGIVRALLRTTNLGIKIPWWKKILPIIVLLVAVSAQGQQLSNTVTRLFPGIPTNPCTSFQIAKNGSNGHFYSCDFVTLTWVDIGPSAGGGVTAVTGTLPISSTGGATPDISISQAGAASDGYLSSVDWGIFNGKQNALVFPLAVNLGGWGTSNGSFTSPGDITLTPTVDMSGYKNINFPQMIAAQFGDGWLADKAGGDFGLQTNFDYATGLLRDVTHPSWSFVPNLTTGWLDIKRSPPTGIAPVYTTVVSFKNDGNLVWGRESAFTWSFHDNAIQDSAFVFDGAGMVSLYAGGSDENIELTPSGAGIVSIANEADAPIFNTTTGFQVNSAATAGNVLRGNGTEFVDAQLACGDLSDSGTGCSGAAYPGLVAHDLLSATHADTVAAAVQRGDVITGQDVAGTTYWKRKAKGGASECLQMDGAGTDVIWGACAAGGFPRLDQVLDPNADKAFTMGRNYLAFLPTADNVGFGDLEVDSTVDSTAGVSVAGYSIGSFPTFVGANNGSHYDDFVSSPIDNRTGGLYSLASYNASPSNLTNHAQTYYAFEAFHTAGEQALSAYSFVTNINSDGVNRWAFYGSGTAPSHFGGVIDAYRFKSSGTALVAGDFSVGANWGNTATVGSISGTDQAFTATVTSAGVGQADSPTLTLTFHDGTWTTVPVFSCTQSGGTGIVSDVEQGGTATTLVLTWLATPTAADTYVFSCTGMGI